MTRTREVSEDEDQNEDQKEDQDEGSVRDVDSMLYLFTISSMYSIRGVPLQRIIMRFICQSQWYNDSMAGMVVYSVGIFVVL